MATGLEENSQPHWCLCATFWQSWTLAFFAFFKEKEKVPARLIDAKHHTQVPPDPLIIIPAPPCHLIQYSLRAFQEEHAPHPRRAIPARGSATNAEPLSTSLLSRSLTAAAAAAGGAAFPFLQLRGDAGHSPGTHGGRDRRRTDEQPRSKILQSGRLVEGGREGVRSD